MMPQSPTPSAQNRTRAVLRTKYTFSFIFNFKRSSVAHTHESQAETVWLRNSPDIDMHAFEGVGRREGREEEKTHAGRI